MKFCDNCGNALEENSKFCSNCGKRLSDEAVVKVSEVASQEVASQQADPEISDTAAVSEPETPIEIKNVSPDTSQVSEADETPQPKDGIVGEENVPSGIYGGSTQSGSYGGSTQSGSYGGSTQSGSYGGSAQTGSHGGVQQPTGKTGYEYGVGNNSPKKKKSIPIAVITGIGAVLLVVLLLVMMIPRLFGNKKEGIYYLSSTVSGGVVTDIEEILSALDVTGMDEFSYYLELKGDGSGSISMFGEVEEFEWDKNKITLSDGTVIKYTYDSKESSITLEEDDTTMTFKKGEKKSTGAKEAETEKTGELAKESVKESAEETKEEKTRDSAEYSAEIPYPSRWYGYAKYTDCYGFEDNSDEIVDIWATIDYYEGYPYIEIYDTPNYDDAEYLTLFMWLEEDPGWLRPDIGEEDSWILDQYLTEEDEFSLLTMYFDGSLDINFEYGNEDFGCHCQFFIREEGAEWDEELDTLPPGYEIYN